MEQPGRSVEPVAGALLVSTAVTLGGCVLMPIAAPLGFLLLLPGVLIATVLGFGHAEGILLAIPASWISYFALAHWHFRRRLKR